MNRMQYVGIILLFLAGFLYEMDFQETVLRKKLQAKQGNDCPNNPFPMKT